MRNARLIAVLLAALCGPAFAENGVPVQELSCTRVSGGPMHDLTLVINDKAKELTVKPEGWLSPDPDLAATEFKGDTIRWSFMRGYAVLDRKTGVLAWDDGGEYDYLETIGHADATDPAENYSGKMQCKVSGAH